MDCPRCEEEIVTYSLSGHDAQICERCGYVGVSVEHERERMSFESWEDALDRFYESS